jgi:hypothetical protein
MPEPYPVATLRMKSRNVLRRPSGQARTAPERDVAMGAVAIVVLGNMGEAAPGY